MSHDATHQKRAAFLAAYRETGTVKAAAKAAGIDRRTHYRWLEDPAYAESFEDARQEAGEALEDEARRRAIQGVEEPVFYQGEVVGFRRRYSDTMLIFLMKGNLPEKYGERVQQSPQSDSSGPIGVVETDDWYGEPLGIAGSS